MNLIKTFFAVSLTGLCLPLCAKPIKVQCTDRIIEYEDQELLNVLKSNAVMIEFGKRSPEEALKLPIDSKGFAFMMVLAAKTDARLFTFIDALDEQTFRLVSFYAQLLQEKRISNLLKYKMIKNPQLQKLAEMPDEVMKEFIAHKYLNWNGRYDTLANKYLNKELNNSGISSNYFGLYDSSTADSRRAFFVLIDFYQETLKKPLPLNTAHLKDIFNAQPTDIQQTLLNKNLITLS